MNEKDVILLLQHYRHDLMNHLQIIHGYLSMNKTDRVESKVQESLEYYNEERKLMHLQGTLLTLWVIQFSSYYNDFRLTYQIHTENKKIMQSDEQLVRICNRVISLISQMHAGMELFEVHLLLEETEIPEFLRVKLSIDGNFINKEEVIDKLNNMEVDFQMSTENTKDGIVCIFTIPCEI
ncbi:Spo0B domain-containing protein [Oceanobacillus manasiensis]|uniref:Spo0B domain-containing protein n=1 Tax=Oceanobacillus manasiensis TaxID=586413 RepID=UPI000694161A|nr:Spo0B domain-containing protein [Oceanobacillus manasiensis]